MGHKQHVLYHFLMPHRFDILPQHLYLRQQEGDKWKTSGKTHIGTLVYQKARDKGNANKITMKLKGSGIVWFFFRLAFFLIHGSVNFPCYLQHFEPGSCYFHSICSILDFEPFFIHSFCIIFMESAASWRWKLSFQRL